MTDAVSVISAERPASLLPRVCFLQTALYLLSLALAIAVKDFQAASEWLEEHPWSVAGDLALAVLIILLFQAVSVEKFRGWSGNLLLILLFSALAAIYGGFLVMIILPDSLLVGLCLLATVSFATGIYSHWLNSKPVSGAEEEGEKEARRFKAYEVIPVGLMLSLGLYGILLVFFHSVMTSHLMVWTFVEGSYLIFLSLELQEMQQDAELTEHDYAAAISRLYSNSVLTLISAFKTKSVTKAK